MARGDLDPAPAGATADPATAPPRPAAGSSTTTAARLALDQQRAAGRRKETYVGPWLPEPRVAPAHERPGDPQHAAALADELSFALLVVLESLSPAQRAAFILHDTCDGEGDPTPAGRIPGRAAARAAPRRRSG